MKKIITGIIQLARSPFLETCNAPNIVKSTCPLLICFILVFKKDILNKY